MSKTDLNSALRLLDFDIESSISTLLFTTKEYNSTEIHFEERLVLDSARRLKATAVFFRRISEKQSSIPQIFIFDNTTNFLSKKELAEIHRKIWSSGVVPVYYVFNNTEINIFDARLPVSYSKVDKDIEISPIDSISLTSQSYELFKKYSAKLFLNGTFWEQRKNNNNFLCKESAETKLIGGLSKIRNLFIQESHLGKGLAHKILVLSILVKYLEERKDENGNHVFQSGFFATYGSANSFCEVIRNGFLVKLFDDLSSHFNGKIFELEHEEREELSKTNLAPLADYLDANIDNDQLVLWPLYSFEYLPVELISRIYEEFIPERNDAVFTPVHLARLMVDECMPVNQPQKCYRVIDVSCGSGVFLVTVFKRLLQWWQKEQFDTTGQIKKPDISIVKDILLKSIYGVDIEADSVRLSVFSLSIALCDMLTPAEIWTNLRFDDLRQKNIYEGDFFKYLQDFQGDKFDLVIGNPPFEDKKKDFNSLYTQFDISRDYHIPRNQIAMLFLQQAMKLLKPGGLLSLVMPSGPLLYNKTVDFRKKFFSQFEIPQIIDFSAFSKKSLLFESSISTAVIFAYNRKPKGEHNILHIAVKRTKSAKEKLFFEIDHYDLHYIPQSIAENDSVVWKTNLFGGDQLYYFIKRLNEIRSFGDFIKQNESSAGLICQEGYQIGNKVHHMPEMTKYFEVKPQSFNENGIEKIENITAEDFQTLRDLRIYKSPHLLIKQSLGKNHFLIELLESEKDLFFNERIIGIHVPNNRSILEGIKTNLNNHYHTYRFFILMTSNENGFNRSTAVFSKKDLMSLPYPEVKSDLDLSRNEEIVMSDVLNFRIEELSKGENALVNIQKASGNELDSFGQIFCKTLNSIYQTENGKFKPLNPIQFVAYTCFPFAYGDENFIPTISQKIQNGDLSELLENEQETIHYRRILRLYQKNMVFLIKPNTLRYWLKSIALKDASDVMIDLIKSGY